MENMDFKKLSPARITYLIKELISFTAVNSKQLLFTIIISVFVCCSVSFAYVIYGVFDTEHNLRRFPSAILRSQETIPNDSGATITIDGVTFSVSKSLEEIKLDAERESLRFRLAETYIDTAEVLYSNKLIGEIKQAGDKIYVEDKRAIEVMGKPILITRKTPVNLVPAFVLIAGAIITPPFYIFLSLVDIERSFQTKRVRRRAKVGNDKETV